ncbi:MAG TPA: M64 family metallopeptidase [Terriglobales bacterium]|nr:M64 family metallopeptidase [Terriglobales bacterium]
MAKSRLEPLAGDHRAVRLGGFILASLLLLSVAGFAAPATMRVDYYHTGDHTEETFSLDRIVLEPLPWPGDLAKSIDDTNLGGYKFEVREASSRRVLYSRGFSSIFAEWVTTAEAKSARRTFSESLRFPAPDNPVEVVVERREEGEFHDAWTIRIDPRDKSIDSSRPAAPGPLLAIQDSGEPAAKVDLLILGDGYTAAERAKFEQDARRFTEILFARSPFREHRQDFNVWGLCPPAEESGISQPSRGIHRRNPLGTSYDTFDTERYILTADNRALRDVASFAPYEFMEILVNAKTYGGGGIFNLYATVAADSEWAPYVFVHEFGHHFAGLADEYYTSQVAYLPPAKAVEPWEPNATRLPDPMNLKWRDLVSPGTPVPTPWRKQEFEALEHEMQTRRQDLRARNRPESEIDLLFQQEKEKQAALLADDQYRERVGAFEGADYQAHGYYRPQENCIMFTRYDSFCAVCRRAIETIIAMYVK